MKEKHSKNNFIMQAGILAAAGMISRVIGLLYRSPLHRVIGKIGLGYYSSAYNYYTIVLLISSYSIPAAISKVIAQKLGAGEYRNAHRIFRCAIWYVLAVGTVASLFLFFAAGRFVAPEAIPVLRTFAPTVFIYGLLGVLRGYFQAYRTFTPTSVSQILEQIANAVVSVGAAVLLIRIGLSNGSIPDTDAGAAARGIRGAIGSAMGTGAGVVTALLFMTWVYFANRKDIFRRIRRDTHEKNDSYGEIFRMITLVVTPFILNTAVYNLCGTVNNYLFTKIYPAVKQLDTVEIHAHWGLYSGQAMTISNIPIAFASAMAVAMIPTVSALTAEGKLDEILRKLRLAVKSTMILSIPCAVGLFVLAKPITHLLFPTNSLQDDQTSAGYLMALALSVVFYALSTLNSQVLQGLGRVNAPIVNAAIALALQTVLAVVLVFFTPMGLMGIVVSGTIYAAVMYCLNQRSVHRAVGYVQEFRETFFLPLCASVLMGAAAKAFYELIYAFSGNNPISLFVSIGLAAVIYFVVLLLLGGVSEQELAAFPKGHLLVKAARKCKLLR